MQLRIMSKNPVSLVKKPTLRPEQDYFRLRKEGIGYIEQTGSRYWTDYNTHDPGITILEALCYAITDIAYRTGKDIKDLLTTEEIPAGKNPFPDQSFFTARSILTVNPLTPNDYRRLLIDQEGIRNAWIGCRECECDTAYYASCKDDKITLSYEKPSKSKSEFVKVSPRGMYDVLLELETDVESGDLNDRKTEHSYTIFDTDGKPHTILIELHIPEWENSDDEGRELFETNHDAFAFANGASFTLSLLHLGATHDYDVLTDPLLDSAGKDAYLHRHWRTLFHAGFGLEINPGGKKISIENVTIRFIGNTVARNECSIAEIKSILEDKSRNGILQRYRNKMLKVSKLIADTRKVLHSHRNLDEDFCQVKLAGIEDVAVCADIEVTADADIEKVQAAVWFELEKYMNPPVPFRSLSEMMEMQVPVEDIFNGPELSNGFIANDDLEKANLRKVLRTSDIVNLLMEIEGVQSVNNLLLTKYNNEGNVVRGASDPKWINGKPVFDANKLSASWLLYISDQHQPRLYLNFSRFMFYKNGLPFVPRQDEAKDTLTQLKGEADRPKYKSAENDLTVPGGRFLNNEDLYPVQYSLPQVYGVSKSGLPSHATLQRQAEARQLKGYLHIYEQLIGNSFSQLAHVGQLFSLSTTVDKTYFVKEFTEELIAGYNDIASGLTKSKLQSYAETQTEFVSRRNRFLNHLMARFGEQFSEYTLMLTNFKGKRIAGKELITDKLAFLKNYPQISHDRAKAFRYTNEICDPLNVSGIEKRINLLLGLPDLAFSWEFQGKKTDPFTVKFTLADKDDQQLIAGTLKIKAKSQNEAIVAAEKLIINQMIQRDAYSIEASAGKFKIIVRDAEGKELAASPGLQADKEASVSFIDELLSWSAHSKTLVVEHLLLRPKFPGDALYAVCNDGPCITCGDEDPYSFRLTFVMPGWTAPFSTNTEMRRFAERTIKAEVPSHLLGKICWVGNDGFIENLCDPVIERLTKLLQQHMIAEGGEPSQNEAACNCAKAIYTAYTNAFGQWYADKTLSVISPSVWKKQLKKVFSEIPASDLSCIAATMTNEEIAELMSEHFAEAASKGWQFERFENAWCEWLRENAAFDWTSEHIQEKVEAILMKNLLSSGSDSKQKVCSCASAVVTEYGAVYYKWMKTNIEAGHELNDFSKFPKPEVLLCTGLKFKPETASQIEEFLEKKYREFRKVSYHLWKVVNLLGELKNTYPAATLHDCDDGSDQNPVRLGNTALGSL